jgi:hypothetical protein
MFGCWMPRFKYQTMRKRKAARLKMVKPLVTAKDISQLGPGRPAIRRRVVLERLADLGTTTLDLSKMTTEQLERMLYELESGEPS